MPMTPPPSDNPGYTRPGWMGMTHPIYEQYWIIVDRFGFMSVRTTHKLQHNPVRTSCRTGNACRSDWLSL